MAIRALVWLALLFALAVAVALFGHFDVGHVVLVYPPYRVDVSLNFCVVALVLGFAVLYALLRALSGVVATPARVAAYRQRWRAGKAHAALREALGYLHAGRFTRAEKAASIAAELGDNLLSASLIGATAAHHMREYARRDAWLARIQHGEWQDARVLTQADLKADGSDPEGALAALAELRGQGARRIYARQIALRAHQQLKQWADVLRLVNLLEKRDALHPTLAARLRQQAVEHLLRERRHDGEALVSFWQSLDASERRVPRLADLAARLLIALRRPQEARAIVEEALGAAWDARLVTRYAECAHDNPRPLIQRAEAWQKTHPDDPDLLFALGRLCLQQQLWGKARVFLEAALPLAGTARLRADMHRTLARLFEALDQPEAAAQHYRASALEALPAA